MRAFKGLLWLESLTILLVAGVFFGASYLGGIEGKTSSFVTVALAVAFAIALIVPNSPHGLSFAIFAGVLAAFIGMHVSELPIGFVLLGFLVLSMVTAFVAGLCEIGWVVRYRWIFLSLFLESLCIFAIFVVSNFLLSILFVGIGIYGTLLLRGVPERILLKSIEPTT